MISRIWHGYTTKSNADAYEALLKSEIFIGIQSRQIAGYKGIQLFRRKLEHCLHDSMLVRNTMKYGQK